MVIAGLIANLHAAVFYVFFILMLPYFAEYLVTVLGEAHLFYKLKIRMQKRKIERLAKKQKPQEKIETAQESLLKTEEFFIKFKERSKQRVENPYKLKLVKKDAVKWLVLVAILCFAMGLLTPIGDEPYTHIFKLLSGDTTKSISEHQPLVLANHTAAITVLMMLFGMLIFTDTKIRLKDVFMLGGLIVLTFTARRQFSLLLIVGVVSFTRIICDFIAKYDKEGTEQFARLMVTWKGKILTVFLIALCSFMMYKDKIDDEYINMKSYPVEASNFMLDAEEDGDLDFETMRLYNDYNYGSYLLYRGIPVFIDSRADLYSPEFNEGCEIFNDYMNISSLATYYETKFEEYKITHAIVYKTSKLNMFLSRDDNYKEIYGDKNFIVYERLNVDTNQNEE